MSNDVALYEERPLTAEAVNTAHALDAVYHAMSLPNKEEAGYVEA